MKKRIFNLVVALLAIASIANAQTTIYAYRCWQNIGGNAVTGPIKFPSNNPRAVTLISDQSKMGHVYAGAYYNYKWYAQVTKPGTQSTVEGLYTIDINTGERKLIVAGGTRVNDMTFDYETNTMYGLSSSIKSLLKVNLETGATSTVANFATSSGSAVELLAIACNAQGQMYGVSPDGNFYKVNKATGVVSAVGVLGAAPAFTQSMEFDRYTNKLYWANNGDYLLYEINITTGEAVPIQFVGAEGYDSVNSLFIPWINAPVGSPDRVTERDAVAKGSDMTISWVNPSIDIQGNTLTDFSGVKIYRDGALVATVNCTIADAGKAASYEDKGLSAGSHSYKIVPFNAKGDGGVDSDAVSAYVGANAPGAVVDFKVAQGDGKALLSWEAPTEGKFGGEFDPSSVTKYVIHRISGTQKTKFEITEGTSFADATSFGTYTYSIYAVNEVGDGVVTTSAPIMVKPEAWIVMTTGEAVVKADKTYTFYDAGGPNASYPNSEIDTLVIRPEIANGVVKVEFTKFDIESYDLLTVFNGNSVKAPKVGEYSATVVPFDLKSLESTANDGSLTFVFQSDIMDHYTGWVANVSVIEKNEFDLVMAGFSGDLYAEQDAAVKYTVAVQNKGVAKVAAADYSIVIKDANGNVVAQANGVDVEPMAVANVEVEAVHVNMGVVTLTATIEYAKDADASNNAANFVVNVIEKGSKFVQIGNGSQEFLVCPASFMSHQSVSQTLYYADEIGVNEGLLKMISFPYYKVAANYPDVPVKVWVAETDRADLKASNLKSDEMTLVFDGNVPVRTTDKEWTIQLSEGYEYKGGTLAIMVYKDAPGTQFEGVTFQGDYCYDNPAAPMRTRFDSPWDETETIDHNALFGWDSERYIPTTKLLFLPSAGVESIIADEVDANTPIEYYNLQGLKVSNPSNGIFIKVQGRKVSKIYVK